MKKRHTPATARLTDRVPSYPIRAYNQLLDRPLLLHREKIVEGVDLAVRVLDFELDYARRHRRRHSG